MTFTSQVKELEILFHKQNTSTAILSLFQTILEEGMENLLVAWEGIGIYLNEHAKFFDLAVLRINVIFARDMIFFSYVVSLLNTSL